MNTLKIKGFRTKIRKKVRLEVPDTVYIEETKSAVNPSGDENSGNLQFTEDNLKKIENDLQEYAKEYRDENYSDTYYDGCGLTPEKYKELKEKMLKSVYENEGFWIGQYEMGTETLRTSKDAELTAPVCKEGAYPYNFVTYKQAQEKASKMVTSGDYTSSLIFGIQWNLVLKYIETKAKWDTSKLNSDSTEWGNYQNAEFTVTKGKYSTDSGKTFADVSGSYQKPENGPNIFFVHQKSCRKK